MVATTLSLEDAVVQAVFSTFDDLRTKSKPILQSNGVQQWVPLSGIVISIDNHADVECIALGTGMRCLPLSKLVEAEGHVLHDWHAEILALRAFNQFLLQECLHLLSSAEHQSKLLRWGDQSSDDLSDGQAFVIRDGIRIHMYCSEAPCGDASMELVMEAQEDASPWPLSTSSTHEQPSALLGRGNFSELGVVRRKPARADSPLTLSKSCSDKLSLKQCTSLLDKRTCPLIRPENAYISSLIMPRSQYREKAVERAFGPTGRMQPLVGREWPGKYKYQRFVVRTTNTEFLCSRRCASASGPSKGSNISAVWNPYLQETLVNGVLQGRKQSDPKGASDVSCAKMSDMTSKILCQLVRRHLKPAICGSEDGPKSVNDREKVKAEARSTTLKGWIRNRIT